MENKNETKEQVAVEETPETFTEEVMEDSESVQTAVVEGVDTVSGDGTGEPLPEFDQENPSDLKDGNVLNPPPEIEEENLGEEASAEDLGIGFIQGEIDHLSEQEKTELGYTISDILATPNQSQSIIVSMVINAILDKVGSVNPNAIEALGQLSTQIVERAATQEYLTLVSEFEGVVSSGLPNATKLSLYSQQLDQFAKRLG
ncbi:Hypothetical protein LE1-0011 [Leptospira phage LE1]|uniref:Uncharacterized protein n=1 Tax=Leptospira phage LE1 TaxID=137511 RepID=Q6NE32_9CAUD|nr:Hypothetical protein HWD53_gp11 [Leptospira phage LE1]CAE14677.1 Hypothetical protein LE1-0011 [Leptospira phage LE1]